MPKLLRRRKALLGRGVGRQRRSHRGVVQRHQRQVQPGAVQVEVTALNPELPEPEPNRRRGVHRLASRVEERQLGGILVLRAC